MPIRNPLGRAHPPEVLAVRELAVDPADVDRERYPVWLRLNRALTAEEIVALGTVAPEVAVEVDGLLVPDSRLDDIAHDISDWNERLERIQRMGEELEGEQALARQHFDEQLRGHGSRSHDRTGEVGMH